MPTPAGVKLLFEIGTGAVRVQIVEDAYGVPEIRLVRYRYSITGIGSETATSDLFDPALISEMICRLNQARTFLAQRSAAAPVVNHQ